MIFFKYKGNPSPHLRVGHGRLASFTIRQNTVLTSYNGETSLVLQGSASGAGLSLLCSRKKNMQPGWSAPHLLPARTHLDPGLHPGALCLGSLLQGGEG